MPQLIRLTLRGLSCGRCIQRVKQALEHHDGVKHADIALTEAHIQTSLSQQQLIMIIQNMGYQATPVTTELTPEEQPQISSGVDYAGSSSEVIHSIQSVQLMIHGMNCASCVSKVETALSKVNGVHNVNVNLTDRSALINGYADIDSLIATVKQAGYQAEIIDDSADFREKMHQSASKAMRRSVWQAALGLIYGFGLMGYGLFSHNMLVTAQNQIGWLVAGLVTLLIMIFAGGHFYLNAWRGLLKGSTTMDTLIALGTGTAWLFSMIVVLWPGHFPPVARHLYFEASAMIIGLINAGQALEHRARQRSSEALQHLIALTPATARQICNNREILLPLNKVIPGMTLRLVTGDRVPVDGIAIEGDALLDESMLTGEPVPVQKRPDDPLHAGTLVQNGTLLFTVKAVGSSTTLARIIQTVRQAQSSKPAIARLADRISAIFVPAVIIIALLSGLVWYLAGPAPQIIYSLIVTTTVLIIACPCALGLATPVSIISGTGRAAELGILIRDANTLEQASLVDTLVFDKTGTLTQGKPTVTQIKTFNQFTESQVLLYAAALEQSSAHPLAHAILSHARAETLPDVTDFQTIAGQGVSGLLNGQSLSLGNHKLMQQHQIETDAATSLINDNTLTGATPVMLAISGKLAAVFMIKDPVRHEAKSVMTHLRQSGYQLIMLTGDHHQTAQNIGREAGLDQIVSEVLPEDKADIIRQLQAQGHKVAMIGDGINDAPALATANAGIAMGSGSDIAIETAGITLLRHHLYDLVNALALAKATRKNMKQNLFGAFLYNSLGIPIAAGVLWPLTGILMNPILAGAAMALSSMTVVTNANRLLRFTPPLSHSPEYSKTVKN